MIRYIKLIMFLTLLWIRQNIVLHFIHYYYITSFLIFYHFSMQYFVILFEYNNHAHDT